MIEHHSEANQEIDELKAEIKKLTIDIEKLGTKIEMCKYLHQDEQDLGYCGTS